MKSDHVYLLHVLDCITKILDYTRDGHESFLSDTKTQDAVIRNIEIISEAVKSVSAELKAAHADVPWQQIARMRDRLIHHYFGVKLDMVWEVVKTDLPGFKVRSWRFSPTCLHARLRLCRVLMEGKLTS